MTRGFKGLGDPDNMVAQHRIYTEAVNKEMSHHQISHVFQLKASSLAVTAPKVNHVNPRLVEERILDHIKTRKELTVSRTIPKTGPTMSLNKLDGKHHSLQTLDDSSDADMVAVVDGITRTTMTPYDKVEVPETSAQEIGWCAIMETNKNGTTWNPNAIPSGSVNDTTKRFWYKPKGQSDVTKYAEIYAKTLHKNPFAREVAPSEEKK